MPCHTDGNPRRGSSSNCCHPQIKLQAQLTAANVEPATLHLTPACPVFYSRVCISSWGKAHFWVAVLTLSVLTPSLALPESCYTVNSLPHTHHFVSQLNEKIANHVRSSSAHTSLSHLESLNKSPTLDNQVSPFPPLYLEPRKCWRKSCKQ